MGFSLQGIKENKRYNVLSYKLLRIKRSSINIFWHKCEGFMLRGCMRQISVFYLAYRSKDNSQSATCNLNVMTY